MAWGFGNGASGFWLSFRVSARLRTMGVVDAATIKPEHVAKPPEAKPPEEQQTVEMAVVVVMVVVVLVVVVAGGGGGGFGRGHSSRNSSSSRVVVALSCGSGSARSTGRINSTWKI